MRSHTLELIGHVVLETRGHFALQTAGEVVVC